MDVEKSPNTKYLASPTYAQLEAAKEQQNFENAIKNWKKNNKTLLKQFVFEQKTTLFLSKALRTVKIGEGFPKKSKTNGFVNKRTIGHLKCNLKYLNSLMKHKNNQLLSVGSKYILYLKNYGPNHIDTINSLKVANGISDFIKNINNTKKRLLNNTQKRLVENLNNNKHKFLQKISPAQDTNPRVVLDSLFLYINDLKKEIMSIQKKTE